MEWMKEEMRKVQHMIDVANLIFSLLFFPALIAVTIILPTIVRFK